MNKNIDQMKDQSMSLDDDFVIEDIEDHLAPDKNAMGQETGWNCSCSSTSCSCTSTSCLYFF